MRNDSHIAAVERLEDKRLLNAVMVFDDSYQLAQQSPLAAPSFVLEVLANDSSAAGGLTITSVQPPLHGTVTIQHDLISAMMGLPPAPDTLLFTPSYGFTGTETLTYTVTDADGNQATATVSLTVTAVTSPTMDGSGTATSGTGSSGSNGSSTIYGGSSSMYGGSSTSGSTTGDSSGSGTATSGSGSSGTTGGTSTGGNTSNTGTADSGDDDPLTLEEQMQQLTDQVTKAQTDLAAGKTQFDGAILGAQSKLKQQQALDEKKHADALAKAQQKLDEKVTAGHDKETAALQTADQTYRDAVTARLTAAVNAIVTAPDPLVSTSTTSDQQDQTRQPPTVDPVNHDPAAPEQVVDPAEALSQYMQWVAGAFGTPGSSDPMTGTTTGSLGTFQSAVKGDAESAFDELRGDANVERDALVAADTDYITALTADQTAYLAVYHGLQQSLQTAVNNANNKVNAAQSAALTTYHQRQQEIASTYNSSMMTTMSMDDYMAQSAARQAAENGAKREYMTTVGRAELTAAQTVGDKYIAAVQSERAARATLMVALRHDENVHSETQAAAKTALQDQTDVTLARFMDEVTTLEGGYATQAEQKYTTFESKVALAEETALTSQQSGNNLLVTTLFGLRIGNWQDQATRFGSQTAAAVGFATTTIDAFGGYLTAEHDADFAALVATHRRQEAQLKSILEADTALATAGAAVRVADVLSTMRDDLQRLLAPDNYQLSQYSPDQMGSVLAGRMMIPMDFTSPTAPENFAAPPDAAPEQAAATQSARTLIDQAATTTQGLCQAGVQTAALQMMMGNAASYAQTLWETIKNVGSQLVQAVGDKFAEIQAAAAAQKPTLLTGDARDGVDVAKILKAASDQLKDAGVPNNEIELRLAIIEAELRTQTRLPTPENPSLRPHPWTDGGDPKASYFVSGGLNNVVQAFKALWAPSTDDSHPNRLWCQQQLEATYIMGFLQYFTVKKSENGICAVSATVDYSSTSEVIGSFVTTVPLDTPLKPGDWVWFANPYHEKYRAQYIALEVTPLRDQAAQAKQDGNIELMKSLTAKADKIENAIHGEEGHNCIYLGKNEDGEDTFSLYGNVETRSKIQRDMANFGDQEWVLVRWAEQLFDLPIHPNDFQIGDIQVPDLTNFPLSP